MTGKESMYMPETLVIKTDFYDKFQCIAGNCPFTCCQEWKIAVDPDTCKKWENYIFDEEEKKKKLCEYVMEKDGEQVIALNKDGICPFLQKEKLCSLVLAYGEEILSETCQIFPREIHEFSKSEKRYVREEKNNRIEKSLMTGCPAVIDLLKKEERFTLQGEQEALKKDFLYMVRKLGIDRVQNPEYSLEQSLLMMGFIFIEIYEKDLRNAEQLWLYEDKKEIKQLAEAMAEIQNEMEDTLLENNELFLDIIENYRKEGRYNKYLEKAADLAESWEGEDIADEVMEDWNTFADQFYKYEPLFRKVLANDFFGNMLLSDSDMDSMVMMLEWSALTYVVIRHYLFLIWHVSGKKELSYEMVRDGIVLISRMTGYTQEDIEEYMENSFESVIWDWGYLALIVGIK